MWGVVVVVDVSVLCLYIMVIVYCGVVAVEVCYLYYLVYCAVLLWCAV